MDGGEPGHRKGFLHLGEVRQLARLPRLKFLQPFFDRSVHNSRIERIWYNITKGFGGKWKDLFTDLEANEGLDVDNLAHIWLLQHLFLDHIVGSLPGTVFGSSQQEVRLAGFLFPAIAC